MWDFMTRGLTLLGNLCGVSALLKDVAEALRQVRKQHAEMTYNQSQ